MDLVEEFLELTRNVSVATLLAFLDVLKRRIPSRHLPKNLQGLVTPSSSGPAHPSKFWKWLDRQPWRRMLPAPFEVEVVLTNPGRVSQNFLGTWELMLPSDVFSSMYHHDFNLFRDKFLGPPGALQEFWRRFRDTDWFRNHPLLSGPGVDLNYVVPLFVHGDDAESHRRRSFMLTTFGSILTAGSVWDTTFLVYCMDNSQSLPETVTTLDSWVAWSLLELSLGHFLDRDPYNRQHPNHAAGRCGPIAGPYKAVLAVHKGDEKYIQKVYKMTHSANSKFVCFTCKAQADGPHVYSTYGPSAPHRSTVMSTSEFISCASGAQSWTRLPGWSVSNLCNDWLHVVDLTVTPECCASALYELSQGDLVWQAENQDERLRLAFCDFVAMCKQHKVRNRGQMFSLKHLFPSGPKSFPTLAQKHFNGSEGVILARYLKGVCLTVAQAFPQDEHAAMRASLFVNLVAMRAAMSKRINPPVHLADENLDKLQKAVYLFHSAHSWLANRSCEREELLWKCRPKYHKMDHLALDVAPLLNPLPLSCYSDEDLVGKCKQLALRCHPNKLGRQVLYRYAAYVCTRWLRQLTE